MSAALYSPEFLEAVDELLGHEGGYVHHPSDPGGETNWGICKRSYPHLNIRALTRAQAVAIYWRDYWLKAGCDRLPRLVARLLFDAAVNAGVGAAVRFMQTAAGVKADGKIGPVTRKAWDAAHPAALCARFLGVRLRHMAGLDHWDAFSEGWAKRVAAELLEIPLYPRSPA